MSFLDSLIRKLSGEVRNGLGNSIKNAVDKAANTITKTLTFNTLPEDLNQLKALPGADLKDPYSVAALSVLALCEFAKNREASIEMLNYLKGPRPLSQMEINFMNDRFMDGVDYIPRSYLGGTSPDNDYTPTVPYTVTVNEFAHSRDNYKDGYLRIFIRSSGADSERFLDLRLKPSTGQWFLWEFSGMLLGIRIPTSKNEWA
ncbi:MAG: hypothetical protein IKG85_04100 [Clostridia bacterium]|nr:hypothetical protein [Clostridia bacterium]